MNYLLIGERIVFRTVHGSKLDAATRHAVVAFEVDEYERDGSAGWSVLVRGNASETTDPRTLTAARSGGLTTWAQDGSADHYISIATAMITGRRYGK